MVTSPTQRIRSALFAEWLGEAEAAEPNDPNAMALATVDADGMPNVRMVLLKGVDERRLRLLHQLRERQGPRAPRPSQGGAAASTGRASAARCACAAPYRQVDRGRGRRLFRQPRRAAAGLAPGRASSRARSNRASPWRRRSPPMRRNSPIGDIPRPALLVGLPPEPGRDRVLVGRRLPPARPHPLHAGGRGLGEVAPLSLTAAFRCRGRRPRCQMSAGSKRWIHSGLTSAEKTRSNSS